MQSDLSWEKEFELMRQSPLISVNHDWYFGDEATVQLHVGARAGGHGVGGGKEFMVPPLFNLMGFCPLLPAPLTNEDRIY